MPLRRTAPALPPELEPSPEPVGRGAEAPAPWRRRLQVVERALRAQGSPDQAEAERAYLKSSHRFYGTGMPELRRLARELRRDFPATTRLELRSIVEFLWSVRVHERWTVGLLLLEQFQPRLDRRDFPFLRRLALRGRWWNYVDLLAVDIAGPLVAKSDRGGTVMEGWTHHSDLWVRRAGLLALLPGLKDGSIDFRVFERLAIPRLTEREFFMRKALGWILREVGKRHPQAVAGFLRRHQRIVAPLTRREAVKYLPLKWRNTS
ncbi:MAG: DNA alkylation repair protein [Thermoplasmata archaeon]|nr:DNA alkylation repair protein [Thermoplasmata archaeon]